MCPAIDNPASCEICAVIHLHQAKNMSAAEIHCEICVVYGQNVISKELKHNGVECSKMCEQMFMMKSKVISHL
jgi:hypothetical protein